jgi:hypothetical protein
MIKDYFLKICDPDTRYDDCDMGTSAQNFYREYFVNAVSCERGETWFTPIALLDDIYRAWNTIKPELDKYPKPKSGTKFRLYKLDIISMISENVRGKKYRIGEDYHCLANFGCVPYGLNKWRGGYDGDSNRKRLGDFPDLFFESVKSFLSGGVYIAEGYDVNIEGAKLSQYDWWFERIGGGKRCSWEEFVKAMNIKGSFVDDKGHPVKLFNHSIGNPFPKLDLQGISVEEFPSKISTVPEISDCITKIYQIWENRAGFLASLTPVSQRRS